ncbi:MAG: TetR/AcrR family transcriptional regulator [Hydrocarboniphaga sp.]|uniref:TetR/AcrR family transcriptional regulator n=1 Tax=Hydrocarboniphaga sp. TaxID=2033016 RepID=UPI002629E3A5|nr:TetR/AcrR family transcriptional regulator [Hydrocarboniphaga sp.]MDB5969888.1 TetR/AcrR family transcriptional regulator [Hydrocarboniphaga sp.]
MTRARERPASPRIASLVPADMTSDAVAQRVIDAAGRCFERLSPGKTTIEDIAAESGVSRATIFRRFGGWDAIFVELLRQQSKPYVDEGLRRLAGPGLLRQRLEESTVHGVMEMPRNRWLKAMLDDGLTPRVLELFKSVFLERIDQAMRAALAGAQANGELRDGIDLHELSEWNLREFMLLTVAGPWDEAALRRRIRQFVFPVIFRAESEAPATVETLPDARLQRIEARLVELHHLLGALPVAAAPAGRSESRKKKI